MITMKGKYNSANIMIDEIDDTTKEQIQGFLNHPAFGNTYIVIMPDCHAGKGAVIGFTMKMNGYVIPNIVGVDIGCGMLSARFPVDNINLELLDSFIKERIPSGFCINKSIDHIFTKNYRPLAVLDIENVCSRIGIDHEKALKAIGSLGGGNHFIEAGNDSEGFLWVTIHSGSRNFGLRVANYYQQKAKDQLEKYFIKDQYKDLEFIPYESEDGQNYMRDLAIAQKFASMNRQEIMRRISLFIGCEPEQKIESVHNFIDRDAIIRKGATPAHEGQKVIIPFNMRDGIAICTGKGLSKYNYSAPHGAGRILSRLQAKTQLSILNFKNQMDEAGIYTTTATAETLDEAPDAYKDKDVILRNIEETVVVTDIIKPIYNFKAGN